MLIQPFQISIQMGNGHLCPGDPGDRSAYNSGKIEVQGARGIASNILICPVVTTITIVANNDIPLLSNCLPCLRQQMPRHPLQPHFHCYGYPCSDVHLLLVPQPHLQITPPVFTRNNYYINGINYYANDFIALMLVTFNIEVL